jgi:phage terminase large subunit
VYTATTATHKLLKLQSRIKGVAGGTSAGKTISILQILIDYADSVPNQLISVVSETFPHLRRGAMRDFLNIMVEHKYFVDDQWSKTDFTYSFNNGSKLEFFSADMPSKVRGPRRDVLFINEANNVPLETFDQLEVRTRKSIWLDWNPTNEFWWYTDVAPNREHDFITLTYKDNEALSSEIIQSIESRKCNKNWWLVYGLGQLGEYEGQIYRDWQIVDEVPHNAKLVRRGLDFGYSVDPTVIVDIYYYNNGYILNETLFRKGLSNKQIADHINNLPDTLVVADSAEPKSIDEIRSYGVRIIPATKGQGSISQGIQWVQEQRVSVTKQSTNVIKEYRNYLWKTDKDGKTLNVPDVGFDHSMDAIRYGFDSLKPPKEKKIRRRKEYDPYSGRLLS